MKLVLVGQTLVDLDDPANAGVKPPKSHEPNKRMPKPKKARPEFRCGQTKESIRPGTYETFINQCTRETHTGGGHLYETRAEKKPKSEQLSLGGVL